MDQKEENEHEKTENLRLLLENKYNDIRYSKQQQWNVIYLTVLAIAGIVSIAFAKGSTFTHSQFLYFLLFCSVILIAIAGGIFLVLYADNISTYRQHKKSYEELLKMPSRSKEIADNKCDTLTITLLFNFIIVLAALVACYTLYSLYQ